MSLKELIMNEVIEFYLESYDFNGIPLYQLSAKHKRDKDRLDKAIIDLIKDGAISLNYTENPHVKQFKDFPVKDQLEQLKKGNPQHICVYPTENILKTLTLTSKYDNKPFTKMLLYGKPQLQPMYFEIQILEDYFNDPRYDVQFSDYSGSISYHSENDLSKKDKIFLSTFGIGYKDKDPYRERVVVVYLRYLSDLTPEHQQRWNTRLVNEKCFEALEYYQNTILGEWAEYGSIYDAFIEELYNINEMSEKMFSKKLFLKTYKNERPEGFRLIFIPTLENYYRFIHLLDKMMSDNINKDFFKGSVSLENEVNRKDGKTFIQNKGTIQLFEEWLKKYFRFEKADAADIIFKPFREVRSLRQKPAHTVSSNKYDKALITEQDNLINRAYEAIRTIRLIFANHPKVRNYKVDNWLYEGKIKTF